MLGEPVADFGALLRSGLTGILVGLDDEMRLRRLGTILPDLVDRIAVDRNQLGPARGERFLRLLHPVAGVQPGIVADARTLRRMLFEPLRRAGLGDRLIAPFGRRNLLAHLQGVAAVDEDRGFFGKHDSRASRAFEPCQPGEPLRVAPDIFAHMLVGQWHDEAV
jgi:hypothetical protein